MFNPWTFGLLASLPGVLAIAGSGFSVGGPLRTTSGTLIGKASDLDPRVSEYLGVPFAKPPLAQRRFLPPAVLDVAHNRTIINATTFVSLLS
jgi:hypothetical protein